METAMMSEYGFPLDPNDFSGSDSQRINAAILAAQQRGGAVRIPRRRPDAESGRDFWLLDSAILLPSGTTLIVSNTKLKLSDRCRDNWIRSANCGDALEIAPLENIHIIGEGSAILEGADHPRATGDYVKTIYSSGTLDHDRGTYGTDAGKAGELQHGDYRNIGVLMVNVCGFSIRNLRVVNSHSWAVVLEHCCRGTVRDIEFESLHYIVVDGRRECVRNQDGLDILRGCHDITAENITGRSGDDIIALCCNADMESGIFPEARVKELQTNDVFNVMIRGVRAHCAGGHHIIRVLNNGGAKIHHVMIDGVLDTSTEQIRDWSTILIGDKNPAWGGVTPLGDTTHIVISNVLSHSKYAIHIAGSLADSLIANVINCNPDTPAVFYESGVEHTRNLTISGVATVGRSC